MAVDTELVDQFIAITGADKVLATNMLEACNCNLEMAINMHMENETGAGGSGAAASGSSSAQPPSLAASAAAAGASNGAGGSSNGVGNDEDDVRAPIPQKQETLVEFGYEGYEMQNRRNSRVRVRSVFDGFRNFEEETRRLEERGGEGGAAEPQGYSRSKKRTLEDLFKPPLEIMYQGDWQSARDQATSSGRWLLVNIQDPKEFQCQVLNRDLWSNDGVKSIINEYFVFWQQYRESEEAQRYMTFYKIANWPYISVIDPRTGENMVTWNKIDANSFPEIITEFLSLHPSLETPEKQPPRKRLKTNDMDDLETGAGGSASANFAELDEDAQLAAAIKASLENVVAGPNKDESKENLELSDDDVSKDSFHNDSQDSSFQSLTNGGSSSSKTVNSKETSGGEKSKLESRLGGASGVIVQNGAKIVNGGDVGDGGGKKEVGGEEVVGWKQYLGSSEDELTNIMIRYPDGEKDAWNYPATSKLKALTEFISEAGYPREVYEVVTNFPRRVITDLDPQQNMKEVKLFPRETVFVQLKE